jgi:signal transduction histidine kinase
MTYKELHFDVSTGLKRVIGRDLITNDEVAIFELVKNSFDANARNVQLYFSSQGLIVIDDGKGMTYDDLTKKWLFVAYSSKSGGSDSSATPGQFRELIAERKHYAGSKGIGRFSSDRLGSTLLMQTRSAAENGLVHEVFVDWGLFEADLREQFGNIPVRYTERKAFTLPPEVNVPEHGTAIFIKVEPKDRLTWDRHRILQLKASLAKLINPFGSDVDGFKITIIAPEEIAADEAEARAPRRTEELSPNEVVNGNIGNFIFSTLRDKTTFIEASISDDGAFINSALNDRGELVYRIREPNPYPWLRQSGFRCELYYLNQSAKMTFARRMGVSSVKFGSAFLFRNGFRVYPIGEEGDDSFGIDRRKQQGYARFLGTRDIIGRLDVSGPEDLFKEASSRNQGLIDSPAVDELKACFWDYCLKRLERYVVPVTWVDPAEKDTEDLSRLLTDAGKARVAGAFAKLIDDTDVEVIEFSKKLIGILNERSNQFEESIVSLRAIALKSSDRSMLESLDRAETRFAELRLAESEAIKIAEEERRAREVAERIAERARDEVNRLEVDLDEEQKRTRFLMSITSLDHDTILNLHHQITIYAADAKQQIENCVAAAKVNGLSPDETVARLESIAFLNHKVLSISRLATKANFRLESDYIEGDLAAYVDDYLTHGAAPYLGSGIELKVNRHDALLVKRFRPIEVAIVIDNLISNAERANATEVVFDLSNSDKKTLLMTVTDNGRGISPSITDVGQIFELGFTRTSGSGIGMYHVRQVLGEMGGSISVDSAVRSGAKFDIKVTA